VAVGVTVRTSILKGEGMEYFAGSGCSLRLRLRPRRDGMTLMEGRAEKEVGTGYGRRNDDVG
jgi:hypothetical protein